VLPSLTSSGSRIAAPTLLALTISPVARAWIIPPAALRLLVLFLLFLPAFVRVKSTVGSLSAFETILAAVT